MSSHVNKNHVLSKEGVLKVPTAGRAPSPKALEEALALELKDCVWEILSRKTFPDHVELRYRYLGKNEWEAVKNLPHSERPLVPQHEKVSAENKWTARVESGFLWVGTGVFALMLLWVGAQLYANTSYASRLEKMLAARESSPVVVTPQRAWVELLNRLNSAGISVLSFEFGVAGGTVEVKKPLFGELETLKKIFAEVLPGKTVLAQKEGVLWQYRE